MTERPGARRLDAETLAAYVDGRLPPEERAKVDVEIAADPELQAWLIDTMHAVDTMPAEAAAAPANTGDGVAAVAPRRPRIAAAVGGMLAAAAAVAVMVWLAQGRRAGPAEPDAIVARLVEAAGAVRYIEPRLTGGFQYGPLRQVMRGSRELAGENLALLAVAGELQRRAAAEGSPETLHTLGVAYVLIGDLGEGLETLERANAAGAATPSLLSDLSAAYAARAGRQERPEDWPRALELADRALALAPELPEALYNRALALDALHLAPQAAAAWRRYLEIDAASAWAGDARRRLDALTQSSALPAWQNGVPRRPTSMAAAAWIRAAPRWAVRRHVEDDVLAAWAREARGGTVVLPEALAAIAGDPNGPADVVTAVAAAARTACVGSVAACRRFALGHEAFAAASALQRQERYAESLSAAEAAVIAVRAIGSPLAQAARLLAARAHLRAAGTAAGLRHLAAIVDGPPGDADVVAAAQAHLGMLAFGDGRLGDVDRHYRAHLRAAEAGAGAPTLMTAHAMLGTLSRYVGDVDRSWGYWVAAGRFGGAADPRSRHLWLIGMANACLAAGWPHAAGSVTAALVANARLLHPAAEVEALATQVRVLAASGRPDLIPAALAAARAVLVGVTDAAFRTRIELQLLSAEAEAPDGDWRRARAAAEQALRIVEAGGETLRLAQLRLAHSRAASRLGDAATAASSLEAGLDAFERERLALGSDDRISYFDASWGLLADRIEAALTRGDLDAAFEAFQDSRGRTLAEARRSRAGRRSLTEAERALGPAGGLLLISQFDTRLSLLVVGHRGARHVWVPMPSGRARALARQVTLDGDVDAAAAAALFDALVRPVQADLRGLDTLWIVPDVPYYDVPFAALVDTATGRRLVQDHGVVFAPTVDQALHPRTDRGVPARAVAVGVVDAGAGTPALPAAGREAAAVRGLYRDGVVLTAAAASPAAVLQALDGAEVIHFAAHGIANEEHPMRSHLQLTARGGDSGRLYATDLSGADLHAARVVFLAACGTAGGVTRRGEGPLSLARAVLAAGAGSVIASLTDVPDEAAAAFSVSVHRQLARGRPVHEALRTAQLDGIARGLPSRVWARTVVVGSGI